MKVAIIDYGIGNIRSVFNAVSCLGADSFIAQKADDLKKADKIILPGVGSFDTGIVNLRNSGLIESLENYVKGKSIPYLGICLGFQFLFDSSEEGQEKGFSWLSGNICEFDNKNVKVPHIGWNEVHINESHQSPIFKGISNKADVYFVHSYFLAQSEVTNPYELASCTYGEPYTVAVQKNNIFGVQFHPEKSQLVGMKILENFLNYG